MATESEPARAIACYERVHGVLVTIHDLDGRLRGLVGAERLSHRHRRCLAAKASGLARCLAFDADRVRVELPAEPAGRVHACPFGVREAAVPCLRDGRLAWTLFAGPLRDDGETALEGLRQLAARLRLWEDAHQAWPRGPRVERGGAGAPTGRAAAIRRWIDNHHREPVALADLAAELGLSRFQASRAVRAACGRGFHELLVAARIATARALLRETDLAVADVAVRSGFGDRAHFHRAFRAATGSTPEGERRVAPADP